MASTDTDTTAPEGTAAKRSDRLISPYKRHLAEVRERIRIHREKEAAAAAEAAEK